MTIISLFAFAEEDYSYLDNMTINQLKKLDEEIHKRLPSSSSSADVTTVNISLSNSGKTDSNEEYAFDEPVTVLDNEYLKMDFI